MWINQREPTGKRLRERVLVLLLATLWRPFTAMARFLRLRGGANRGPIVLTLDEVEFLIDCLPPPPEASALRGRLNALLGALRSGQPVPAEVAGERPSSRSPSVDHEVRGSRYRSPALTVDAAVLRGPREALEILLVTRAREPFKGKLAFPGGFVEYNEDPQDAVVRELAEECGIQAKNPQLVAVRGHPSRDPRQHVVTVCYKLDIEGQHEPRAGDDAANAGWYAVETLLKSHEGRARLAFDHADLLAQLAAWLDQRHRR